jgi:hypothetical protein
MKGRGVDVALGIGSARHDWAGEGDELALQLAGARDTEPCRKTFFEG